MPAGTAFFARQVLVTEGIEVLEGERDGRRVLLPQSTALLACTTRHAKAGAPSFSISLRPRELELMPEVPKPKQVHFLQSSSPLIMLLEFDSNFFSLLLHHQFYWKPSELHLPRLCVINSPVTQFHSNELNASRASRFETQITAPRWHPEVAIESRPVGVPERGN